VEPKKTPLYDEHVRLGGKMADFAGWMLPLWYTTGQSKEHHATRTACGLYDIFHMGEFRIEGGKALSFLSWMLTHDIEAMVDGQAKYNFMLNEAGGVVDDCILYRFNAERFMLVVNAGNAQGDFKWLSGHAPAGVRLENMSDQTVKIDLQGPHAPKLLSRWVKTGLENLKFFHFLPEADIAGMKVLVSRTGYTGEIGFELYTDLENAKKLWNLLLDEGRDLGILPCGLGARDTLRTEAGLPLHGHELRPDLIPLGNPWQFAIDENTPFLGKKAYFAEKEKGGYRRVYPFVMDGKRKAMSGWEMLKGAKPAGVALSGVIAPSMNNTPIGFMETRLELSPGDRVAFRQQGKTELLEGKVAEIPFVPLTSRKKMSLFL